MLCFVFVTVVPKALCMCIVQEWSARWQVLGRLDGQMEQPMLLSFMIPMLHLWIQMGLSSSLTITTTGSEGLALLVRS